MKKIVLRYGIFFLLLITLHNNSFAQKFETAIELNDHFSEINLRLYSIGKGWGERMNIIGKTSKRYDSLAQIRRNLEVFIEDKKALLSKMKDQFGSKDFREAMIKFLDYEKSLVIKAFIPIEQLNPASTKDEITEAMNNLVKLAKEETDYIAKIRTAQYAYAKTNNFTIEGMEEEEDN